MSQPLTAPPDVIRWVHRSGDHDDCSVAAIALACGVTYERALAAVLVFEPNVLAGGIQWVNLGKAVRSLGHKTKVLPFEKIDLSSDGLSGILELEPVQSPKYTHVVYLWKGRVIEPKADRRELWEDPEQFFNHYGYRVGRLLTIKEDA